MTLKLNLELFNSFKSIGQCIKYRDELLSSDVINELKEIITEGNIEQKKETGPKLTAIRNQINQACDNQIKVIQIENEKDNYLDFDPSFHSDKYKQKQTPSLHPITQTTIELVEIFKRKGFDIHLSPQVETQLNNFTIPNTPDYHPARSMQDTFFLDNLDQNNEPLVMRTQTTSSLASYKTTENNQEVKLPFGFISPGIVFRAENIDLTHDINFHQLEMWYFDKTVTVSSLITIIQSVFSEFFNDPELKVRLRPSYFPFTQPSIEGDIYCKWFKSGNWVEVFGSGMAHNNVIKNLKMNPDEVQGMAFGFGITRLAQLKLELSGLAQFYSGDLTFLD